jgi:hypothetical protein
MNYPGSLLALYPEQSSPLHGRRPSTAQPFSVFVPVGIYDVIYVRSKTVYMFVNGVFSSTKGGVGVS